MVRFSIRELLLLMVVVGLAFGWWLHVRRTKNEVTALRTKVAEKETVRLVYQFLRASQSDLSIQSQRVFEREDRLEVPSLDLLFQELLKKTPPQESPLHLLILEGNRA
jgi:hypothetical protein